MAHYQWLRTPYFYVYRDRIREWRWRFRASNEKIIADSGEGYKNQSDCESAIALLKREAPSAPIIRQRV